MCGICGVFGKTGIGEADHAVVDEMTDRLFHRGPDSAGRFTSEACILSMRRLSIIDLEGGRQPLFNEAGDIAIVCNGEIYNHAELRSELTARGHSFATQSDVETIIHAYEDEGLACLKRLRGMFAFALWDGRRRELILARDRMGEKPLYLHSSPDGNLWFSSELRSITAAMPKPLRIAPRAFNLFMAFQYVPEPHSPLCDLEQLPAGTYAVLSPIKIDVTPVPFWDPLEACAPNEKPVAVTEEVLEKACRLMGTADVPVAVALSGGIDSSLVAAISARQFPGKLHAFTIGYEGRPKNDERGFASELSDTLGIGFTEVELSVSSFVESFPDLMDALDTPIGDIAAFGYYSVAKAAREAGFPVLLSGLGGDEIFWGYEWVREALIKNEKKLAKQNGFSRIMQGIFGLNRNKRLQFFDVHPDLYNGDKWSRELMHENLLEEVPDGFWLEGQSLDLGKPLHIATMDLLNRTWLRSNCLALIDRMTMAHSVEGRLPLLDVQLIDRIVGMRNLGLRDWDKGHKWLLVEALRDVLPADVLSRRKQGFSPPSRDWMYAIEEYFLPNVVGGVLCQMCILRGDITLAEISKYDHFFKYKLIVFEMWARSLTRI